LFRSDAPSAAIVAELTPLDAELVIEKGAVNPFIGTPLHAQLTNRGVVHLVLGGVATNHVVEGTARYAADCGYEVTVLEDLCASATAALHDFSVKEILPAYGTVTSSVDALGRLHGTDDRPGSHDD
jgi:nicotinamidase-related amidase